MVEHNVRYCMKNSFGFGGINAVGILRTPTPEEANLGELGKTLRALGGSP